jgi:hypothetical protein
MEGRTPYQVFKADIKKGETKTAKTTSKKTSRKEGKKAA